MRPTVTPLRPTARVADSVRIPAAATASALVSLARRAIGRGRRPAWTARLESTIAAYRGAWSVMPRIGIVRWRNVGEAMSPIRTDGLEPRFVQFDGPGGAIDGMWLEPANAGGLVLLYYHGGGFCFGSFRTHGVLIGALARAMSARAFAPEYRLAPEHPAPAAHEDALAAYRHLLSLGIPPERIVLAGDSAGGTLVLSTLCALREAGERLPAAGIAISPWVDLSCSGDSFRTNATFDFVGEVHCRLAAASYLAGTDPRSPAISPLFSEATGLPPVLVQSGGAEVLRDQIQAFVERARDEGAGVTLSTYPDMVHVWHLMRDVTPDGQRAIDEAAAFARAHVPLNATVK